MFALDHGAAGGAAAAGPAEGTEEVNRCVGCMTVSASVKIAQPCACKPMWCFECLGKWFASRQPQNFPEQWLAGYVYARAIKAQHHR